MWKIPQARAKVPSVIRTGRASERIMSMIGESPRDLGLLSHIMEREIIKSIAGKIPIIFTLPFIEDSN